MFSNFSLVVRSSSIRPGLSPEDEEVKRKLAKCRPRVYSELIRSDILKPSGVSPSRSPAFSPSLPFVMNTSHEGPSVMKPTREELQARVESLAKKKRSVKIKLWLPSRVALRFGVRSQSWECLLHRRSLKGGGRLIKFQREVGRLHSWSRCPRWWARKLPRGGAPSFLLLFCLFIFGVP